MIETLYSDVIKFDIIYHKYTVEILLYKEHGLTNLQLGVFEGVGLLSPVQRTLTEVLETGLWPEFFTKLYENIKPQWVELVFKNLNQKIKPKYLHRNSNKLLLFQVFHTWKADTHAVWEFEEKYHVKATLDNFKERLVDIYYSLTLSDKNQRMLELIFAQTYLADMAKKPLKYHLHDRYLDKVSEPGSKL